MVRSPTLTIIQRKLRESICRRCANAPLSSNLLGSWVPRRCEADCPLFKQLPRLKRAAELFDPILRPRRLELEHVIRQMSVEGRGVTRGRREPRGKSALERYGKRIAAAIDAVYRW
jgi:hypothetical protein